MRARFVEQRHQRRRGPRDELVDRRRVSPRLQIAFAEVQQVAARLHLARTAEVLEADRQALERAETGGDGVPRHDRAELDRKGVERSGELVARDHEWCREPLARPRLYAPRARIQIRKAQPRDHHERPDRFVRRRIVRIAGVDPEHDDGAQPVGHDRTEIICQDLDDPLNVGCHEVIVGTAQGCTANPEPGTQPGTQNLKPGT